MSYHFITKSKKSKEERLQEEIVDIINSMLKDRSKLTLSFLTNKLTWSPVLRLLFETRELGPYSKIDKKNTEIFKNSKGLILKNTLYENLKISDADGVFAILDARNTEHIDPKWNDLVKKIIKNIDDNKVLSIGIATTEKGDWPKLTEKINELRKSIIELLFVEGNHFCPSCEKSGNCELQALAYRYKMMAPRFPYQFPMRKVYASLPKIIKEQNRCILCKRCIRTIKDKKGRSIFAYRRRSTRAEVIVDNKLGCKLTDELAQKAMDVCPVGSIIYKEKGFNIPIGKRKYDEKPIGSEIDDLNVSK